MYFRELLDLHHTGTDVDEIVEVGTRSKFLFRNTNIEICITKSKLLSMLKYQEN